MNDTKIVILAGGQGTRFWPISRMQRPKQFLSISESGESLIQATARRVQPMVKSGDVWIVTNIVHKPLVVEHVPAARVITEPVGRNTAASIGLAAVHARHEGGDPVLIVLPADHAVKDEVKLRKTLEAGVAIASKRNLLVTIGVSPTSPNTGYGYIQKGKVLEGSAHSVTRFYEKPNFERAVRYFESGDFLWNSGMFAWRSSVILEAIAEFMPSLYEGLLKIEKSIGTSSEDLVVREVFATLSSESIDFGILEHAKETAVVVAEEFGWNDVGSWDAWAEYFDKDKDNNLLYGSAMVIDAKNCVVHSRNKLIAVLGAEDLVIIDSGDAMLVCPRSRVQDVRKVVDELKKQGRSELT